MTHRRRWRKVAMAIGILLSFSLALWTGPSEFGFGPVTTAVQRFSLPAEHLMTAFLGRDKSPYFQEKTILQASNLQRALEAIERDYSHMDQGEILEADATDTAYRLSYVLPVAYKNLGGVQVIKLNKGGRHGLEEGMPLVSAQGYLGKITYVDAYYALARLATDARETTAVENMSGQANLAQGRPYAQTMTLARASSDWMEGEPAFVQEGEAIPGGLVLGTYGQSKQTPTLTATATPLDDAIVFVMMDWTGPTEEGEAET